MATDSAEGAETAPKEKPKKGSSGRLVVWLVAMSMGMLFLPLWLMSSTLQEDVTALETEYAQLSEALNLTPTPDAAAEVLRESLLALRGDHVSLEAAAEQLAAQHYDWYGIMNMLLQYDQNGMQLTHVTQIEIGLTVEGIAANEDAILGYVNSLRASDFFNGVQVQSIQREEAEEEQSAGYAFQLLVELAGVQDDG